MNYKWRLFWHQVIVMAFENHMRTVFTVLGIFSGLLIYSTGNLLLNSYYESRMYELEQMPRNAFYTVFYGTDEEEVSKKLLFAANQIPMIEKVASDQECVMFGEYQGKMLYVGGRVHGISKSSDVLISYTGTYGGNMVDTALKSGRYMTDQEISNNEKVCMLDEYGAQMLFGKTNPIGQKVLFHYYSDAEEYEYPVEAYEVVGVLKNQYYSEKQKKDFLVQMMDEERSEIYAYINIYCPYAVNAYLPELTIEQYYYVWNCDPQNVSSVKGQVQTACEGVQSANLNVIDVVDREKRIMEVKQELTPLRAGFLTVTVLLVMIAGISSMSILFFCMKERMGEIGVKKAFGAAGWQLLLQFLMENVFVSILASVFAIAGSLLLGIMAKDFICSNILDDFHLYIHAGTIWKPLFFGILFGVFFSAVPCLFYASKDVVELLREKD